MHSIGHLFALLALLLHVAQSSLDSSSYTCPNAPVSLASAGPGDAHYDTKPFISGARTFLGGVIGPFSGEVIPVTSPIIDSSTNKRTVIGEMAQMREADAMQALAAAQRAWSNGQGTWPQMSAAERIAALQNVVAALKLRRAEIVNALMWEICKTSADAALEFDRTVLFIEATLKAYRDADSASTWRTVQGVLARVRRAAIGIVLCLGPFNYPINETYTTLIPALLSGNVLILKIPTLGGLAHVLTMEAYAQHLPPGTINFISGSGRGVHMLCLSACLPARSGCRYRSSTHCAHTHTLTHTLFLTQTHTPHVATMSPLMKSGTIDALAFIGGSVAADAIIKDHPHPHRLKLFLQLEGKNLGIVLPDADLDVAVEQVAIGATTFNGQRCTAIKLVFVHASLADSFVEKLATRIASLKVGQP